MEVLDIGEKIAIDFIAARIADDENPGFEGRLIDIITEDHVKRAIVEYFSESEEWSDDLLPAALEMYRATEAMEDIATALVSHMFFV